MESARIMRELVDRIDEDNYGLKNAIIDYNTAQVAIDDMKIIVNGYGEASELAVLDEYMQKISDTVFDMHKPDGFYLDICIEAAEKCPSLAELGVSFSKNKTISDLAYNTSSGRLNICHKEDKIEISVDEVAEYKIVGTQALADTISNINREIAKTAESAIKDMGVDSEVAELALEYFKDDLSCQTSENKYFEGLNKDLREAHNGKITDTFALVIKNEINYAENNLAKEAEKADVAKNNPSLD